MSKKPDKKTYKPINRTKPLVAVTLEKRHIDWLDKSVANKSKFIGDLIDIAMLLPHPEDLRNIVERHIKAKMLDSHRHEQFGK